MTFLIFIIVIILLTVFAPSVLFLTIGGGLSVFSGLVMVITSVIISAPPVVVLFYVKEKILKRKSVDLGLNGVEYNAAKYIKNEKNIWSLSILSGMAYAFVGMFIYDSTHDYQNSSDLGMFYSIFVPSIVGIFVTYCIVAYRITIKRMGRIAKGKMFSKKKLKS